MKHNYYFVCGLPRSGSTLLCNILAQNSAFYATATSGLIGMLVSVRNAWDATAPMQAMPREASEEAKLRVLRAMLGAYYPEQAPEHVFDKSRVWLGYPELLEWLLGERPKFIVTVRDLDEVLASIEQRWRATAARRMPPFVNERPVAAFSALERVSQYLDSAAGVVGVPMNMIRDALARGYGDCMHFVEFDQLTDNPKRAMQGLYEWLELDYYDHDFDNVEQVTVEDDFHHGFHELHNIRRAVKPVPYKAEDVFTDEIREAPLWKQIVELRRFWEPKKKERRHRGARD